MCIWEKAQNLGNEKNYKVPECCFHGDPLGRHGSTAVGKQSLDLQSGYPRMEVGAQTSFTRTARTIAPSEICMANSGREMYGHRTGRKSSLYLPSLTPRNLGTWHTVWTKNNNNKSPYSFRERLWAIFQEASSLITFHMPPCPQTPASAAEAIYAALPFKREEPRLYWSLSSCLLAWCLYSQTICTTERYRGS